MYERSSDQTKSTTLIKPFPDGLSHRLALTNWKYHVQAVAHDSNNNTKDSGGLLGHLLSDAAYEAKFKALGLVEFPYISIQAPVEPIGALLNNRMAWKQYERQLFFAKL